MFFLPVEKHHQHDAATTVLHRAFVNFLFVPLTGSDGDPVQTGNNVLLLDRWTLVGTGLVSLAAWFLKLPTGTPDKSKSFRS